MKRYWIGVLASVFLSLGIAYAVGRLVAPEPSHVALSAAVAIVVAAGIGGLFTRRFSRARPQGSRSTAMCWAFLWALATALAVFTSSGDQTAQLLLWGAAPFLLLGATAAAALGGILFHRVARG